MGRQKFIPLSVGIKSIATPFPQTRSRHKTGTDSIPVNIPHQVKGMLVGLDRQALVTIEPEMPLPLPSFIVVTGVFPVDEMHGLCKGHRFAWLYEEMHMCVHQFVIEELKTVLFLEEVQDVEITAKVLFRFKMSIAVITTNDDMIM